MLWWMSGPGEGVWTPLSASKRVFRDSGRGIGGGSLGSQLTMEVKSRWKSYRPPSLLASSVLVSPTRLPLILQHRVHLLDCCLSSPAMAGLSASHSLQELLTAALPKDVPFTFYHYSTPPTRSAALYSAPPHLKPERTFCESQFLAVSIIPKDGASIGTKDELLVLAIEVLIYTTKHLTTIFVSKADSTGYLARLGLPREQAGSPLKAICGTFVSWLARERQREGKKLVVSLFARAQDQYLFPASIENKDKHVLDDRGLVKWWCKVLDPLVREYAVEAERKTLTEQMKNGAVSIGTLKEECTAKGHLIIPGFDPYDTLRYVPPPPEPTATRRWASSHPLLQIAPYPGAPPRCLVPHFPDDPKSRYLDELDEELPDRGSDAMTAEGGTPSRSNGMWKSIKTLDQFWEMMAFRQECSSGRIVGFIWVVITPPTLSIAEEDETQTEPSSFSQPVSHNESQDSIAALVSPPKEKPTRNPKKPRRRKVNTETGPIPLIIPRIKSTTSNLSTTSNGSTSTSTKLPPERSTYFTWPAHTRGKVVFSTRDYNRAHEVLLQQNFATPAACARSTKRWKDEVAVLGGVVHWSWTVLGRKDVTQTAGGGVSAPQANIVNTVIGVRKKRKPDTGGSSQGMPVEGVTTLSEVLVRKKVKTEASSDSLKGGVGAGAGADGPAINVHGGGVNTLAAGLVRKKPRS
jgi:regulator of Ty1 transposition protein 109